MSRTSPRRFVPSPSPTFSAEDVLAELTALQNTHPQAQGMTSREMARAKGWSIRRVNILLQRAHDEERLVCAVVNRLAIDGSMRPSRVYRILPAR